MIFIILFGGISLALFLVASLMAKPIVVHRMEPLSKENKYLYITSIVLMVIAVIIFLLSPYTVNDLSNVIDQL